jgi:hypothetical protein
MARIRTIKPEFWTDDKIVELSAYARLLFIGMWNFADDGGNMPASYKSIKLQVLPADDVDVVALVNELKAANLIKEYTVEDKTYLNITGWRHQKIDHPSYKFPKIGETSLNTREHSRTIANNRKSSPPEGKGREGNGKEGIEETFPPARKRASRLPNDWVLPPEYRDFALGEKFSSDHINSEAEKFADYWRGNGVAKADWLATWRNWIRRSSEFKNSNTQKPPSQQRFMR